MLDQAASSLGNIVPALLVAHVLSVRAFGSYAIAYYMFLLLLGVSRSFATDPLVVRHSNASAGDASAASTAAFAIGALGALGLAASGAVAGGSTGWMLIALGSVLPLLTFQDAIRYVAFNRGLPGLALASDVTMVIAEVALLVGAAAAGLLSVPAALVLWGVGAALGVLVVWSRLAIVIDYGRALRWVRGHSAIGVRYLGDYVGAVGARPLTVFIAASAIGVTGIAALRGVQAAFGPITALDLAVGIFIVPEGVRLRDSGKGIRSLAIAAGATLVLASLLYTVGVDALPGNLGKLALGSTWPAVRHLVIPTGVMVGANGVAAACWAVLRIRRATRRGLGTRALAAATVVASGVVGGYVFGLEGLVRGQAAGACVAALIYLHALRTTSTESVRRTVGVIAAVD